MTHHTNHPARALVLRRMLPQYPADAARLLAEIERSGDILRRESEPVRMPAPPRPWPSLRVCGRAPG